MSMALWEKYLGLPLLKMHDRIYQKTEGRIGHQFPGVPPSLLLHTVGAKTGLARTTSLTYAKDGDSYLVVASKGGEPTAPGWYFNLSQPRDRNQRRDKANPGHGPRGRQGRPRLRAAVADREQEQRQPVRGLSEAHHPAHPGGRADAPLEQLLGEQP